MVTKEATSTSASNSVAAKKTPTTAKTGAAGLAAKKAPKTTGEPKTAVKSVGRKELVQRVVDRSGMKPNQVKTALDAILHEIGEVVSRGEMLAVQPLGKLVVNRKKESSGADVYICKLRRRKAADEAAPATPDPAQTAAE